MTPATDHALAPRRWRALAAVLCKPWLLALLCSIAVLGCTVDTLDRESDKLLDRINGTSSSSSTSSRPAKSGLSVVKRKAMPMIIVRDGHGNEVPVWGQSTSTSKTPGHDQAIKVLANQLAASGRCEYVTMQRAWRTATGREASSGLIPDVICVRRDGKVDAYEIKSDTDDAIDLRERLQKGLDTLPPERRGDIDVLVPEDVL